ncbi:hematopoietic death receptor isoform X2 [Clarias gariepinus]|uniref:hematopoietic death receptor isoform X2 n=1 Tax=Clarias gariepinus TaxID=13013 RepID=UPI00234DCD4F|nr:hematopoietic death receptor isoform X2 [Clarias gariepinus]
MKHIYSLLIFWIWAGISGGSRTQRDVACHEGRGYIYNGICCINCPAGTFVKDGCSKEMEKGVCQPCDFDSYTEHDNGLFKCLQCTQCRSDQELVTRCNNTSNTRCQCKPGSFCLPDQACEVCKICMKCKEDEEVVNSCTANSNTICRKNEKLSSRKLSATVIPVVVVVIIVIIMVIGFLYWRTSAGCREAVAPRWLMCKTCIENDDLVEVKQNSMNCTLEEGAQTQPFLCLTQSENDKLRRLVPVNGDDSLKKSFDLFGEMDVTYHNRFFRLLGLSDNAIRTAEVSWSSPEDRVYELLKIWMEKEGMTADFNSLIDVLLTLNQRLSAENIVARAINSSYFRYEED